MNNEEDSLNLNDVLSELNKIYSELESQSDTSFITRIIEDIKQSKTFTIQEGLNDLNKINLLLDEMSEVYFNVLNIHLDHIDETEENKIKSRNEILELISTYRKTINLVLLRFKCELVTLHKHIELSKKINGKLSVELRKVERPYKSQMREIANTIWEHNLAATYTHIINEARKKFNIIETDDTLKKFLSAIDPLPKNMKRTKRGEIQEVKK